MSLTVAQHLTAVLARGFGEQPAVVLVHSGAVVAHAAAMSILNPTGDLCGDLETLAALHPALAALIDPAANPALHAASSSQLAEIAAIWQDGTATEPGDAPRDPGYGHTLGDLYQHLSVEARKGRALCQTPWWITSTLLDISWDHAYEEGGPHIRMIDPSCGTGHILTEALKRASIRQHLGPARSSRDDSPRLGWRIPALERVHAALDTVHGVDLDPWAAVVARYRLLALALLELRSFRYAPDADEVAALPLHVAQANSLLDEAEPLLERGRYDVVIANPPYITVKDKRVSEAIRKRYPETCHMKYSLALPFHQLMNELLRPGGWCAQLTGNSFMKREFGQKYIEDYLVKYDLRWVIDTSGAYIPGHGTPTVILVNRNQPPTSDKVATILSDRGEPTKPADPSRGLVWTDIARMVDERESWARFKAAATAAEPVAEPAAPEPPTVPVVYVQPTLFDLLEVA